ncbi:metallophosphoesterase [bacterium]|nr:metallophosphoesterase [bacterium]
MNYGKCFLFVVLLCMFVVTGVGATDFYMLQTSDTHYIGGMICNGSRACVQAMNNMPGMSWPYGTIGTPTGLIVCGDLCDGGAWGTTYASDLDAWYTNRDYEHQWNGFDYNFPQYGVQGDNNRCRYPSYSVGGNHDYWRWCGYTLGTSTYVANKLYTRHGGGVSGEGNNYYAYNINGIRFVALGRYPDATVRSWLASYLASIGTTTPVVLFLHYALNDDEEWWSYAVRDALADVLDGYNIIAILHGHTHNTMHYTWEGYDVYDDGSATYFGGINVLHITDDTLEVAHYYAICSGGDPDETAGGYWDGGYFTWSYSKSY